MGTTAPRRGGALGGSGDGAGVDNTAVITATAAAAAARCARIPAFRPPRRQRHAASPAARATIATAPFGASSGLVVPRVCFGCMLFGESTGEAAAADLLSMCADAGAAFFDVAEMYPVPQRAETYGRSEEILGAWMRGRPR